MSAEITVFDVAKYILHKKGRISCVKLQKLVYYSQAWSLVWDDKPLFKEQVEAWANGPVVRELYDAHRGRFDIVKSAITGDSRRLSQIQKDTIDAVVRFYGDKSSQWLSDLTHSELPWVKARKGLAPGARGYGIISCESMAEYYSSLPKHG